MEDHARRSSAHLPEWARTFQREMFEAGYLVPGWPPELGGRNATPQEQMVYFEVITERHGAALAQPAGPLHLRRLHRRVRDRGPEGALRRCRP